MLHIDTEPSCLGCTLLPYWDKAHGAVSDIDWSQHPVYSARLTTLTTFGQQQTHSSVCILPSMVQQVYLVVCYFAYSLSHLTESTLGLTWQPQFEMRRLFVNRSAAHKPIVVLNTAAPVTRNRVQEPAAVPRSRDICCITRVQGHYSASPNVCAKLGCFLLKANQ